MFVQLPSLLIMACILDFLEQGSTMEWPLSGYLLLNLGRRCIAHGSTVLIHMAFANHSWLKARLQEGRRVL